MIFVSGIHGVGKTFFCNMVKKELGIKSFSASQLITEKRKKGFSNDKMVSDIDANQSLLLEALEELRDSEEEFILDGHFCLLNNQGEIIRIPLETYFLLKPNAIVLLTERAEIISKRRLKRDGIEQKISEIKAFQEAEKIYAQQIAEKLKIPIIISGGADDLTRIIKII